MSTGWPILSLPAKSLPRGRSGLAPDRHRSGFRGATLRFSLNRNKLHNVRRREGRYLLRTNLCEQDPAQLNGSSTFSSSRSPHRDNLSKSCSASLSRTRPSKGRPMKWCALRAQGRPLRAIAATFRRMGHRISHEGVAGVLKAVGEGPIRAVGSPPTDRPARSLTVNSPSAGGPFPRS